MVYGIAEPTRGNPDANVSKIKRRLETRRIGESLEWLRNSAQFPWHECACG